MNIEDIPALPKVLLHDHLDGGLRPDTVIELAAEAGHELPAPQAAALGTWFRDAADSGSLVRYLETFDHTVAVMQTATQLTRVAREAVEDLAADGVIYAELRWAPEQHQRQGLSLAEAVAAVRAGINEGIASAAAQGRDIVTKQILTAMRHADRWQEVAELAVAERNRGVAGFDIAGAELGFPADRFVDVWQYLADQSFPVTIHAGEADGPASIAAAVSRGRARRIGHGVRIAEDIAGFGTDTVGGTAANATDRFGRLSAWVRDWQVPLEVCPSSNVQTGAATSIAEHPITRLRDDGFAVTINTDNRLMSGTSMSREMTLLVSEAHWDAASLRDATVAAARNAFIPHDQRERLIATITAAYAAIA